MSRGQCLDFCSRSILTDDILNIIVSTSRSRSLYGRIDQNADSVFTVDEQIFPDLASLGLGKVIKSKPLPVSCNAVVSATFIIRLKYSTDIGLMSSGIASNGEVDDCLITINQSSETPPPLLPTLGVSSLVSLVKQKSTMIFVISVAINC